MSDSMEFLEKEELPPSVVGKTMANMMGSQTQDPNEGRKFDADKTQWDLIPESLLREVADVFTYGARKYDRHNWKEVEDGVYRYYNASRRHISKFLEWLDTGDPELLINRDDGGSHHLANAIASLFIVWWYTKNVERMKFSENNAPEWFKKDD